MNKLTRRKAIKTTIGVSAGMMMGAALQAAPQDRVVDRLALKTASNLVKHGRPKGDDFMIWSMMSAQDVEAINEFMTQARLKYKYRTQIKYSGNDRYKVEVCKHIIDAIGKRTDVSFQMVAFKGYQDSIKGLSPGKFTQRVLNAHRKLGKSVSGEVLVKSENAFGPSREFNDALQGINGHRLVAIQTKYSELIQINDLLSGCLFGMLSERGVASNTKNQIINQFKETYKVDKNLPNSFGNITFEHASF